jgi:dTDP-4-amino-4,6-dideoxygalactose transaminase
MEVPFLDLKAQYRSIKTEVDKAVLDVLASTTYVLGPEVEKFEREFAELHQAKFGIAVNTGTSALHVALLAAGVGAGDEVITVSMTFIATAAAIRYTGATPVFVDVDPETCTMDVSQIEAKIGPRTRAIMPVHLYGQPADMDPIMEIAARRNLIVIEDAAQAHGAEYKGRRVGSIGHIAGFSFYPGKNLGAYGEAGIATTNDPKAAHTMRLLRDWGQEKKYYHDVHAFNYRMDAVQGGVLRVKLRHLEKWTQARRAHAAAYNDLFRAAGIKHVRESAGRRHVYHIYSVFHEHRSDLQRALLEAGVQTGIHYPVPVHLQRAYASLGYKAGDLPVTERIANQQLSLPMFAELADEQIRYVADAINAYSVSESPARRRLITVNGAANGDA